MRKGEGSATIPQVETNDLQRKILVDGETVAISEATKEQFDIFVYETLGKMYKRPKRALNCYEQLFWDYDFEEPLARMFALNKLRKLNKIRAGAPAYNPEISLFVEEPAHV